MANQLTLTAITDIEKVSSEHQKVVKDLGLAERVFKTTPRPSFFTLKDHKENFQQKPQIRILNPRKCEIGKISKRFLERIVVSVHWKHTLGKKR